MWRRERSKAHPLLTSRWELLTKQWTLNNQGSVCVCAFVRARVQCRPLENHSLTSPHHHYPHSTSLLGLASGPASANLQAMPGSTFNLWSGVSWCEDLSYRGARCRVKRNRARVYGRLAVLAINLAVRHGRSLLCQLFDLPNCLLTSSPIIKQ